MLVTIEGGDGTGKSTLARALASAYPDAVSTREPGGTPLGEAVRAILLAHGGSIDAMTECLLFAAARAQLVGDVLRPARADGLLVICDRYVESSLAYQGAGRGLGIDRVRAVNDVATGGLGSDLVLLLDVDPAVPQSRTAGRAPDRMESADAAFHARVRDAYLSLAGDEPDRFVVIDAGATPADVVGAAVTAIDSRR